MFSCRITYMRYGFLNTPPDRVRRGVFFLREYFFPFGCSVCGASLAGIDETWNGLCTCCLEEIGHILAERREGESCGYCGKPLIAEQDRCLSCRNGQGHLFDRAAVIFPYAGKYRRLLAAYKFRKNIALGNYFAGIVRDEVERWTIPQGAAIVPVPPRPGKIRKTGWDQVEFLAKLLESSAAGTGSLPVNRCLKRLSSKSQKELGLENRRSNLKGRIVPVRTVPKIAVVLDDVMTTGSTLEACACALKEAGTDTVYGLCLFYD